MSYSPIKPLVREALKALANKPLAVPDLARIIGTSPSPARTRLMALVELRYASKKNQVYSITDLGREALIHAPSDGYHTGAYTKAKPTVIKTQMVGPPYLCPELGRNPGLPEERFDFLKHPSRIGNKLFYKDGRIENYPN